MTLLPGVRAATVDTARIRMHYLEAGCAAGSPIIIVHGTWSAGPPAAPRSPGTPWTIPSRR